MSFLYELEVFSKIVGPLEKTAQQNLDLNTRNLASKFVNNLDVDLNASDTVTSNVDYELKLTDMKDINDFILFLFKNEVKFNNSLIVKQEIDASESDKTSRKLYEVDFDGSKYNVLIDTNSLTEYLNYLTNKAQDTSDQVVLSLVNGLRSSLQGVIADIATKAKELTQKETLSDDMAISVVPSQYSENTTSGSAVIAVKDIKDQFKFNNWLESNNITVTGKDLYSNLGTVLYWLNVKFNDLKTRAKDHLELEKAKFGLEKLQELAKTYNVIIQKPVLNEVNTNQVNKSAPNQTNQNQSQIQNNQQNQNAYFNKAVNNLPFRPYNISVSKFRTFFDNLRQFDPAYNALISQSLNSLNDAANLTVSNLDVFMLNGGAASLYQKVRGQNAKEKLNNFYLMLEKLQEGIVFAKEIIDALYYKEEKPIRDNRSLDNEFRLQVGKSPTDTSAFSDNMKLLRSIKSEVQKNIVEVNKR